MEKFIAVVVAGGRLFKGAAYLVGGEYEQRWGYAGSGVAPLTITTKVRVWDPLTQKFYWVNEKFVADREVSAEQFAQDKAAYTDGILASTVAWCRSKSAGKAEDEILRFAYNVVRKNHADLVPAFEAKYGFKVDVPAMVKSTVDWAFNLGYRADKSARIAFRALYKKGLTVKDGFAAAWAGVLATHGAEKYAARYLAA